MTRPPSDMGAPVPAARGASVGPNRRPVRGRTAWGRRPRREAAVVGAVVGVLALALAVVKVTWWDPEVTAWPVVAGAAAGALLGVWPALRVRRWHRAGGTFEPGPHRPVRYAVIWGALWAPMMFAPPPVSAGLMAALGVLVLMLSLGFALP